jgi:DNA polymerase-4
MTAEPIASRPQAALSTLCRDCLELVAAGGGACPRCGSPRTSSHPELGDLAIAHIDCDAFYAAIEKRDDPSLFDRPVIIGHAGGRGVVTTAGYVAPLRASLGDADVPGAAALSRCGGHSTRRGQLQAGEPPDPRDPAIGRP